MPSFDDIRSLIKGHPDDQDEPDENEGPEQEQREGPEDEVSKRRAASPKTVLTQSVTKRMLSKTLLYAFRFAAWATRSTAEFESNEFDLAADDLLQTINRYPFLRVIFNALHPILACGRLVEKAKKIAAGRNGQQVQDDTAA